MTDGCVAIVVHEAGRAVLPKSRKALKKHHQERRLGEKADHHLAARSHGAEGGADVHRGERLKDARRGKEADQRDGVGRARKGKVGRNRRDDRRGEHHGPKQNIGRHAKQRRGSLRPARRPCGRACAACDRAGSAAAPCGSAARRGIARSSPKRVARARWRSNHFVRIAGPT